MELTILLDNKFLDLCCLSNSWAEVVELCSSDTTSYDNFNLLNSWRMHWENSFNANTIADLSDCESLSDTAVVLGNYNTFESLDSFCCSFNNLEENFNCITNTEILSILFDLLSFNRSNDVHNHRPLLY